MSISNFIPSVWASEILRALDTLLVYANPDIINTDYEGDIANAGDTVRINMLGDVNIFDYTKDSDITAPQSLTDAQLTLAIDQQKAFNFIVDDIDKRQANADLRTEAARRAAYAVRKAVDSFVAGHYTEIDAGNFLGSDGAPITGFSALATKAYDQLVALGVLLDEDDTPEDGRFVVLPPWYCGYLQKDQRFTGYGTVGNREQLTKGMPAAENGLCGEAAGFRCYRSNQQVPNIAGAKWKIIAGHKSGWSMATQLTETVAFRPERRFGDAMKGLTVYGAKVVRPSNLACLVASDI